MEPARRQAAWIFGYGSLVWRPAFPHAECRTAWLEGYARRFWQGSTDHRGVPGAPGRVVTLVPSAGARCGGVAYRVAGPGAEAVLAGLDHRERGGYARLERTLVLDAPDGRRVPGLVYLAASDNPNYLGPLPVEAIASQVAGARGPSGANAEYVLELARALRERGLDDEHVFAVEAALAAAQARG